MRPSASRDELVLPSDRFGRSARLEACRSFPLLGAPLEVRSNAARVLELADAAFGHWRRLEAARVEAWTPAVLEVVVMPAAGGPPPERLEYRRHGADFLLGAGPVLGSVRLDDRRAVVFVPADALDLVEWFTSRVLDLAWLLCSQRSRVPLHAAALAGRHGAVVVLGASGAGKSTLAWAGRAAGLAVLSEDAVFVDVEAARLWGAAAVHWLSPDAAAFFPEVERWPLVARASGKTRRRVPGDPALLTTDLPVSVVLLSREGREASLAPADAEAVARAVEQDRTEGFDQYPEQRPALVRWLRTRPAFRLDAGTDPRAAAALLRERVDAP